MMAFGKGRFFCWLKSTFLLSRISFLSRSPANSFSRSIFDKHKIKDEKTSLFDQNHGLTPLKKCQFSGFFNRCFYSRERLVFYIGSKHG